jgi:predicted unusual protein kinase regulating ubiquinone biosynthesis (AarF/ABC1/UbiB family)
LSYIDPGLPEELRAAFGALGKAASPLSLDAVCTVIENELGAAAREVLRTLRSSPIATSALAQVHRSTLLDGTPVAVKVRHPDVKERLGRDLVPALADRLASWFRGAGSLAAVAKQLGDCVQQECDYTLTAQRQERFWWLFASHPTVVVPSVMRAFSSAGVLTSEFVTGVRLEKFLASRPSQEVRDRVGQALFDFYVGTLFEHGLYDCDPHPDNHVLLPDGRVAFVDFGCAREAEPAVVSRVAALTHALWADEPELIRRALVALGLADADEPDVDDFTRSVIHAAFGPMLRDEVAVFAPRPQPGLADVLQRWRKTSLPIVSIELLFLLRTALGVATLLGQVGARANWRQRLQALLGTHPQPSFDVVLLHPGKSTIVMARELRDATGLPLREIEYIMTKSPQTIKQALPRAEAEALRVRLEKAGARIELKLVSIR